MIRRLRRAIREWDAEVEVEAARMIERGIAPATAMKTAAQIVGERRHEAAMRREGNE